MTGELDTRLLRLKAELDDHARIARYLGLDFERPIQSLGDGYPENAIAWVGKITERLLKQLWRHHNVPGTPVGKTLKDLISGCRPYIRSHTVIEALHDIQRLRNRSAHDGYQIADEDGLTAVRRLLDVLAWYTSTGSGALSGHVPRLAPAVAAKAEFLAGLYVTLDYRLAKRFELSQHTVYQLFVRERGLRSEYVELLLSRDVSDVAKVLAVTGGELLQTRLPKLTRFLILENGSGEVPDALRDDCRVVTYDHFMDAFVDLGRHLADVAGLYPRLDAATVPVAGDLLTADERSGQMRITEAGAASALLDEVAASGGNLLIVGRPGSGKTTLLKQLVTSAAVAGARRYRFFFDLSLKDRAESFADFVARTLAPYMAVEAAYVYPAFCYFARAGSVMCAVDGFDEAVSELTQVGFLELFAELAEVLSAESAVVMTSRVSFLEDSPQVRRLMDGTSLMSEKLIQQLHAEGVDPLRVPRFSVLRLRDETSGGSLLGAQLASELGPEGQACSSVSGAAGPGGPGSPSDLDDLLWRHITQVVEPGLLPKVVEVFGRCDHVHLRRPGQRAGYRGVRGRPRQPGRIPADGTFPSGRSLGRMGRRGIRRCRGGVPACCLPGAAGCRVPAHRRGPCGCGDRRVAAEAHRAGPAVPVPPWRRCRWHRRLHPACGSVRGRARPLPDAAPHRSAGPARPVPRHRRPVQAVPRRCRARWVGAVGSPGHASGLRPRAVARTAPGAWLLRRSRLRQPPGGRGQLVERVCVRPFRGQAAADLPGMGGRRARHRRAAVPLG